MSPTGHDKDTYFHAHCSFPSAWRAWSLETVRLVHSKPNSLSTFYVSQQLSPRCPLHRHEHSCALCWVGRPRTGEADLCSLVRVREKPFSTFWKGGKNPGVSSHLNNNPHPGESRMSSIQDPAHTSLHHQYKPQSTSSPEKSKQICLTMTPAGSFWQWKEKKAEHLILTTVLGGGKLNSVKSPCLRWSFKLGTVLLIIIIIIINLRKTHNKCQMINFETESKPELPFSQCYPALAHTSRKTSLKYMTSFLQALVLQSISQCWKIFIFFQKYQSVCWA